MLARIGYLSKAIDMNHKDLRAAVTNKFNIKHPPGYSIIYSELSITYMDMLTIVGLDINDPFREDILALRSWANEHGVLEDLNDRLYTWALYDAPSDAIRIRLFLDIPDTETRTIFALCHPHIKC